MFSPMQMMNLLQSNNPMAMAQQMFGDNPMFQRAMQMGQGKSESELQQIVQNLAHQRGMNDFQLNQFLNNYGLKI